MILSKSARRELAQAANGIHGFAKWFVGIVLRPYQREAALAIVNSVANRDGLTFVIIFSRQSGKDELLAIIFLFLLLRFYEWGADMVCAQPTFKPQTVNAMERLRKRGASFGRTLIRTAGFIIRLGQARVSYFSAEPSANQVGATADRLLVMNEAQDISPAVYDKRFSPMAASGNATKVFSGTSWTSNTLLAREKRAALELEKQDGIRRVFIVDADQVGRSNQLYRQHVQAEIKKLGRNHPFIKTQYFCEEIDAQAGMFNAARRALMLGDQPPQDQPLPGRAYAFLIDVAGQDEARLSLEDDAPLDNAGRDALTLSIVEIDLSSLELLGFPTYRVIKRFAWIGENHVRMFGRLKALGDSWRPLHFVIDATGVGEGLYAMLDRAFPSGDARIPRVIPVKFSQATKSEIGYGFIAVIETGRFRDCSLSVSGGAPSQLVDLQYLNVHSEILPGPAKTMRWGVPEGARDPATGALIHDDHVIADSLTAVLDRLEWALSQPSAILQRDLQKEIDGAY